MTGIEPEGKQIKDAVALEAAVDRLELPAEPVPDQVAEQVARAQEGEGWRRAPEAKETRITPRSRPKTAPPAMVITAAPGIEKRGDRDIEQEARWPFPRARRWSRSAASSPPPRLQHVEGEPVADVKKLEEEGGEGGRR